MAYVVCTAADSTRCRILARLAYCGRSFGESAFIEANLEASFAAVNRTFVVGAGLSSVPVRPCGFSPVPSPGFTYSLCSFCDSHLDFASQDSFVDFERLPGGFVP